ncbi:MULTISPECIES: hypothetical protein [unclassified Bradyrhizobium]|uniref:hypothetical protein n=1 Tax=unclassified Bradyrhizobium TaxID=2631580 RepID=UPI003394EF01
MSTSVFDPMVNEWNTKNAPKPEEFKHPEAVHEIAEIPDVQPVSFHVPLLNDPE